MSTPVKEETVEQVAERIAKTYTPSHAARAHLRQAVLSALRNERAIAFDQGFILAVAEIMRQHGEDVIAKDVLRANRPDCWDHIDGYDMEALKPIFEDERREAQTK